MRKATSSELPSSDEIFYADDRWIRFMSNRNYVAQFMRVIAMNSRLKESVCYQGNVFFSTKENITPLIDEETHDIISTTPTKFKSVKGQTIYGSTAQYISQHLPVDNCANIYFVGDVHGSSMGGDFNVHWNCCIVLLTKNKAEIVWYDPALSKESAEMGEYDFSPAKKQAFIKAITSITGKLPVRSIVPVVRAQRVCNPAFVCVDSFCQSWVLIFASSYIEGKENEFLNLRFDLYANLILKTWLYCLVKNEGLKDWMTELKTKELKVFEYCRLPPIAFKSSTNKGAIKELRILKVETLKKERGETCLDAVIRRFSS